MFFELHNLVDLNTPQSLLSIPPLSFTVVMLLNCGGITAAPLGTVPPSMRTRRCWCCGEPVFCRFNRTASFWTWYYYIPTSRNSDDCSWERICTYCYVDLLENRANRFEKRLTSLYNRLDMSDEINDLLTVDGEYLESRCYLNR